MVAVTNCPISQIMLLLGLDHAAITIIPMNTVAVEFRIHRTKLQKLCIIRPSFEHN